MFKQFFKRKPDSEIDFNKIDLNLSEQGKESIKKFASRTDDQRMTDIMMLGDKGDVNFFYLMYYVTLFDKDLNVRFAALKRLHKFQRSADFNLLIKKLNEPGVGEELEPYYSMMLLRIGQITEDELNKRLDDETQKNVARKPITSLEEALSQVTNGFTSEEETLWISDMINDAMGMNMAIIGDSILKAGYMPSGHEQKIGYRIYKYRKEN